MEKMNEKEEKTSESTGAMSPGQILLEVIIDGESPHRAAYFKRCPRCGYKEPSIYEVDARDAFEHLVEENRVHKCRPEPEEISVEDIRAENEWYEKQARGEECEW